MPRSPCPKLCQRGCERGGPQGVCRCHRCVCLAYAGADPGTGGAALHTSGRRGVRARAMSVCALQASPRSARCLSCAYVTNGARQGARMRRGGRAARAGSLRQVTPQLHKAGHRASIAASGAPAGAPVPHPASRAASSSDGAPRPVPCPACGARGAPRGRRRGARGAARGCGSRLHVTCYGAAARPPRGGCRAPPPPRPACARVRCCPPLTTPAYSVHGAFVSRLCLACVRIPIT